MVRCRQDLRARSRGRAGVLASATSLNRLEPVLPIVARGAHYKRAFPASTPALKNVRRIHRAT